MAKKTKHYTGNITFDVWGNMQEYSHINDISLTEDNIDFGAILLDEWDSKLRQHVRKPVFYTPDQLQIEFFDNPQPRSQWDLNGKDYIAKIKSGVEVPNFVFNDTLEYHEHYYGRSSTCFYVKSQTTSRIYRVFLKDLESFIRNMDKGVMTGDFTFSKKGYKFGIKIA